MTSGVFYGPPVFTLNQFSACSAGNRPPFGSALLADLYLLHFRMAAAITRLQSDLLLVISLHFSVLVALYRLYLVAFQ